MAAVSQGRKVAGAMAAQPRVSKPAAPGRVPPASTAAKPEPEILFQQYFKSVGPRTYAAQMKKAGNGNHFLVLTEGKRDDATGEVRKTRLYLYSEDFAQFFKMLHETAQFIRQNPLPEEVRKRREKFWAKQNGATEAMPKPT
jgi:hypothetical protein